MKGDTNEWMRGEQPSKGKIALLVAAFENILKIADRLVSVNEQGEVEFWRHGNECRLHI